ncbi:MAG TPA: MDR family MFS transporter [Natronosporangium sp.]
MTVQTQAAASDQGYLSHRQILVVLVGLMAGMFLAALDQSIVGTALPRIVSDLGGLNHLSWVVTAYLLTSTASTPLWGKISDLYGRRPIFQTAILVFVAGSLVSALAGDMAVLIGGRAVQGLGAGGLMALALSIIGDVIPPRERGRYQGYFGAVFGISTVGGPLLGGWLTDGPGWEWIFWINVPIGLAALVVTSLALRMPRVRRDHSIDYLGAAVIVGSVTSILLYTSWAGGEFGWGDPYSLALLIGGILLAGAFVWVESRAAEPIIPLRLFRNRVFSPTVAFTALMGLAMFGGIIFLPVYLQVVQGMSPTESGLALLPMMAGVFLTSIGSGQLMTKTGRYKLYPILGAAVTIVGFLLLSTLDVDTPYWRVAVFIFVLGAGLGFTMQIVITAVQNAVERRDMGSATSSVTFFRMMGGAFGTAIFGAVLANRLSYHLAGSGAGDQLPAGTDEAAIANNVQAIQALPPAVKEVVLGAWVNSVQELFLVAVPFAVVALVLACFIPEVELKRAEPNPADADGAEPAPVASAPVGH